jgi:hypothetical protein
MSIDFPSLIFFGHLFLIIIDIFFVLMPFWLVYMETYGLDFLKASFVMYIRKYHHHHHQQ